MAVVRNGQRFRPLGAPAFTVKEKIEALDRIKSGVKRSHVANELGVHESTVRGWKKEEAKLREMVLDMHESEGMMRK